MTRLFELFVAEWLRTHLPVRYRPEAPGTARNRQTPLDRKLLKTNAGRFGWHLDHDQQTLAGSAGTSICLVFSRLFLSLRCFTLRAASAPTGRDLEKRILSYPALDSGASILVPPTSAGV